MPEQEQLEDRVGLHILQELGTSIHKHMHTQIQLCVYMYIDA